MCTTAVAFWVRAISTCTLTGSPYDLRPKVARSKVAHDLRLKVAIKGRARSAMMAYLGDTTTAHNVAPPPRSTTTTPARVTYPCSHRQCQLGVQGVGAEQRNPLTLPPIQRQNSQYLISSPRVLPENWLSTALQRGIGEIVTEILYTRHFYCMWTVRLVIYLCPLLVSCPSNFEPH